MTPNADRPILPVILSGGSGTRLWPMSRSALPKQFLRLAPPLTMLQATAERARDPSLFSAPIIVGSAGHAGLIADQLAEIGIDPQSIILEPSARNTAPAIALAAASALAADPEAVLLVMPSDQVISDIAAFHRAVTAALPVVKDGWLATFGIAPTAPETGYGYIHRGPAIAEGVDRVDRFVEKPDLATAEAYLATGEYAWNGGIFLFRAETLVDALQTHAPSIWEAAAAAIAGATRDGTLIHPDADAFAASPSDSIDYAVMERADRVAVVPVDMGWSDIGSWDALHDHSSQDDGGNHHAGQIVAFDTHNCQLRSEGPLLAAVGISDLTVIATDDAVLVCPRGRSQEVKAIVDALKADDHGALHRPVRHAADWGESRQLLQSGRLDMLEFVINPGAAMPPRQLAQTAELRLLDGEGEIDGHGPLYGEPLRLAAGTRVFVRNTGSTPLRFLEMQTKDQPW